MTMAVKLTLTGVTKLRYLDSGLQEPDFERALQQDKTRYLLVAVEPERDIKTRGNIDDEAQLTTELRVSAIEPVIGFDAEETAIEFMKDLNSRRTKLFRESERKRKEADGQEDLFQAPES